jgi:hypothetical protein
MEQCHVGGTNLIKTFTHLSNSLECSFKLWEHVLNLPLSQKENELNGSFCIANTKLLEPYERYVQTISDVYSLHMKFPNPSSDVNTM